MPEELSYNNTQANELYETVAENILSRPQIVKMDEQAPANDTSCRHEELIPDLMDTIGDAVYHGCSNYRCGVGFYLRLKT